MLIDHHTQKKEACVDDPAHSTEPAGQAQVIDEERVTSLCALRHPFAIVKRGDHSSLQVLDANQVLVDLHEVVLNEANAPRRRALFVILMPVWNTTQRQTRRRSHRDISENVPYCMVNYYISRITQLTALPHIPLLE